MTSKEFIRLHNTNCSKYIEKKDCGNNRKLSYLSWAWAWREFMRVFPDATYEVVKFNGLPYICDPIVGIMVYTRVTAAGDTREMWLPVMDSSNRAMKLKAYTYRAYNYQKKEYEDKVVKAADMFDVNKAIMRCLAKNLAMFGLGLSIYSGEDIPEQLTEEEEEAAMQEFSAEQEQDEPKKEQDDGKKAMTMDEYRNGGLAPVIDWFVRHYDKSIADVHQADIDKIHTSYHWEEGLFDLVLNEARQKAFQQDLNS